MPGGGLDAACAAKLHPSRRRRRMRRMDAPLPPPPAGAALADADLSPGQARSLRRRLLARVADTEQSLVTVQADAAPWQGFTPGVEIKVLREHAGVLSYLLRLAPGASLPAHRHPLDEECLVLAGTLQVGSQLEVGPGGYHLAPQGALHAAISTATGATIFLRGAVPEAGHELV